MALNQTSFSSTSFITPLASRRAETPIESLTSVKSIVLKSTTYEPVGVILVIDSSGSMSEVTASGRTCIAEALEGAARLRELACEDGRLRSCMDMGVILFNDVTEILQTMRPVSEVQSIRSVAAGCTAMGAAVETAVEMADEWRRLYQKMKGVQPYKPRIVLLSDGLPTDEVERAARLVCEHESQGLLHFISLGCGDFDSATLHKFGDQVFALDDYDFKPFFGSLFRSFASLSHTGVFAPIEAENVDRVR